MAALKRQTTRQGSDGLLRQAQDASSTLATSGGAKKMAGAKKADALPQLDKDNSSAQPCSARLLGKNALMQGKLGVEPDDDEPMRDTLRERLLPELPPLRALQAQSAEQHPMHDMAALGRVHAVEGLIQAGSDREKQDAFGRTPLHLAAMLGHDTVVRFFTRIGVKLETKDLTGMAPLHAAAANGHKQVITVLIDARSDIDGICAHGKTALHHAVDGMQAEVCRHLIALKAETESRSDRVPTPLMLAVHTGHTIVLDTLIDAKCDMHCVDDEGATPLHIAACKQRLEIMDVLVRRGARSENSDNWGLLAIHRAARSGEHEAVCKLVHLKAAVSSRTAVGRQSALHLAALAGELKTIEVLAEAKANLDAQDTRGYTAVHAAVEAERLEALEKLLHLGLSRDLLTKAGDAAVHLAVHRQKMQLVQCLISYNCNVNSRGRGGFTPLHVASELGFMQGAVALLGMDKAAPATPVPVSPKAVDFGRGVNTASDVAGQLANPNAKDEKRQTPLHIAAWHGRPKLCQLLVQTNSEVDAVDIEGCTPLSLSVSKDHESTVKVLLRLRADPMRPNPQGLGPLQLACMCGSLTVTKTLAEMRMLPRVDEVSWRRPMALAKFYGHQAIVDYFFKPCPKNRLALHMVQGKLDSVSATFMTVSSEPPVTAVRLEALEYPMPEDEEAKNAEGEEEPITKLTIAIPNEDEECDSNSPAMTPLDSVADETDKKIQSTAAPPNWDELFAQAEANGTIAGERVVEEKEWLVGGTISIAGLKPRTRYVLRLVAENDAGISTGAPVEVATHDPGDASRRNKLGDDMAPRRNQMRKNSRRLSKRNLPVIAGLQ